jgi:type IV pilus assembly protein PilM
MSRLPAFLVSSPPSVGVEIASDRVTAVSLAKQAGAWVINAHATERLAPGVVTPALNAVNVHDRRALAAALRSAFDKVGGRPRRIALVIPDSAAKISLLRFEKVPAAADLDQLIRWQVRKAAPFKPEDAQISWVPAAAIPGGGREYLVTLARRDVVETYMQACADAGADAGVVDLASLNLINATLASGGSTTAGDWLIVHVAPDYATLTIVRDGHLILFRSMQLDAEGVLADAVHQTAMYHEDRLGGAKFTRVVLSGASAHGANGERLRRGLEERMGVRVESLDFRGTAAMRDRISAAPDVLDTLAPALGAILRERVA